MELSLLEAATLLGVPVRTLRARVERGEVPARKVGRAWRVKSGDLPRSTKQRDAMLERAAQVEAEVREVLPGRNQERRRPERGLADLDAFRHIVTLAQQHADEPLLAAPLREAASRVAEAVFVFERAHELDALRRARVALASGAAAWSLLHGLDEAANPIEREALPDGGPAR